MTATELLQVIFAALCWSNNTVEQWFPNAVPQELIYVPQRDIAN